jgi:hypothetical protein
MLQKKHQVATCLLAVATAVALGGLTAHADRQRPSKHVTD